MFSATIRQLLPYIGEQSRLFNLYGPAEATIVATRYEVCREELSRITTVPIGRPLSGYHIYLLDRYRQPVVPGRQGEIVIGGWLYISCKIDEMTCVV